MKIRFSLLILFIVVSTITVHATSTDFYVCDIDLVSESRDEYYKPWPPVFLSKECQEVFSKETTDPNAYKLYADEANGFNDFIKAIEQYETKKSGKGLCEGSEYAMDGLDRFKFYKQVDLFECYKSNNKEIFLQCAVNKRKKLVGVITDATTHL